MAPLAFCPRGAFSPHLPLSPPPPPTQWLENPSPFRATANEVLMALDVCANIRVIQYANSNALNIVRIDSFTSFVAAGLSLTFSRLLSSVVARWSAFLSHSLTLGFSFYVRRSVCPPSFSHFALLPNQQKELPQYRSAAAAAPQRRPRLARMALALPLLFSDDATALGTMPSSFSIQTVS